MRAFECVKIFGPAVRLYLTRPQTLPPLSAVGRVRTIAAYVLRYLCEIQLADPGGGRSHAGLQWSHNPALAKANSERLFLWLVIKLIVLMESPRRPQLVYALASLL